MSYKEYVEQNFERLTGISPQKEDAERIAGVLDQVLADLDVCVNTHKGTFDLDTDSFPRYLEALRLQNKGGHNV